jgi:protein YibB
MIVQHQGLPIGLGDYAQVHCNPPQPPVSDPFESTIVTAFFDLRRADWIEREGRPSNFRRGVDEYFDWFERLARLKNRFVVFTDRNSAQRVLDARARAGLELQTAIVTIEGLFDAPPVAKAVTDAAKRMTPQFRRWLLHPEYPEFREPRYAVLTALKPTFANTAIEFGLVGSAQLAWIDFGYCRDDERFDPTITWRFDAGDRMNLFHVTDLDNAPISRVVRFGTPYMQAGHIVGPTSAWPAFATEISRAFEALLACDLVDDEQTLMLMAWRREPEKYCLHAVSRGDWRVVFRRFNCDTPLERAAAEPAPKQRDESPLMEEIRISLKRWEWRLKRWRGKLGFP